MPFAAALGGLLGGYVGDVAATRWPHHGRIWACQFSVFIGIPFSILILKVCDNGRLSFGRCFQVKSDIPL
jgi:hypothetical protein